MAVRATDMVTVFTTGTRVVTAFTSGPQGRSGEGDGSGGVGIDDTVVSRETSWSSEETQEQINALAPRLLAPGGEVGQVPVQDEEGKMGWANWPIPALGNVGNLLSIGSTPDGGRELVFRPDRLPGLRLLRRHQLKVSGTHFKDPDGVLFRLKAVGAGASGAAGGCGDASANRIGGGGGASGSETEDWFLAEDLAESWPFTIGAAGNPAAGVFTATGGVVGNNGNAGGDTFIALRPNLVMRAPGGAPGLNTGAGGAIRSIGNTAQSQNSGGGTAPSTGQSGGANAIGAKAPGGGAAGGGILTTATTVGTNGGSSFRSQRHNYGASVGSQGVNLSAAGGNNVGSNGADAPEADPGMSGNGGGGGGSSPNANGGRGGNGSWPGGGSGGGGAARNGFTSGGSGTPGDGGILIEVYGYAPLDAPIMTVSSAAFLINEVSASSDIPMIEARRYQVIDNATGRKTNVIHWDGESDLGPLYDGYTVEPDDGTPIWSPPEPTPQEKLAAFLSENQDVLALVSPT